MIYSFTIAVLILGIAAFFGISQKKRLGDLETQWLTLTEKAGSYGVPTDPNQDYATGRLSHRASTQVRPGEVGSFRQKLADLIRDRDENDLNGGGNGVEIEQRGLTLMGELSGFSSPEVKQLIDELIADPSLDGRLKREILMTSIMILSEDEPEAALDFLLNMEAGLFQKGRLAPEMIGMAVAQLAKKDPQAAVAWLSAHEGEIGKIDDEAREQILEAASAHLKEAVTIISDLGFESRSKAFTILSKKITPENVDDFLKVIREEGDQNLSENSFRHLAKSPLAEDVEKATAFIEGKRITADERASFIEGLSYYQLGESTPQWLDWMVSRRSMDRTASRNLISQWVRDDFRAAGEWVSTLEKGGQRDQAASTYASTLAENEPQAAATWAESLPKGAMQNRVRGDIYRLWKKQNPSAAASYAERHGLAQ